MKIRALILCPIALTLVLFTGLAFAVTTTPNSTQAKKKKKKQPNRRIVVFGALVGVLTLTSALLLAIAPAPLNPDASSTLLALDSAESMGVVFQTQVPAKAGRWKYIYVHHSHSDANTAPESGDHFIIGNGEGTLDGQIQMTHRWDQQLSATPPGGASEIDPACSVVGDADIAALQQSEQHTPAMQNDDADGTGGHALHAQTLPMGKNDCEGTAIEPGQQLA